MILQGSNLGSSAVNTPIRVVTTRKVCDCDLAVNVFGKAAPCMEQTTRVCRSKVANDAGDEVCGAGFDDCSAVGNDWVEAKQMVVLQHTHDRIALEVEKGLGRRHR